jgi:hypothetical protein
MLVYPKLHFWPFNSAHMDLIFSICLLCTCTYSHIKVVSPTWCIEQLITTTGTNGPIAHILLISRETNKNLGKINLK